MEPDKICSRLGTIFSRLDGGDIAPGTLIH